MVFAARDGEEVRMVSSQQLLLHHHCLTLLSIHSSTRPFIQGLLPPPPPPAVQLICKEVQEQQEQAVVSRVWMDGRVQLSAAPATNFLHTSSYSYCCTRHVAQPPTLPIYLSFALQIHRRCNTSQLALFWQGKNGDVGTYENLFNMNIFKRIQRDPPQLNTSKGKHLLWWCAHAIWE